MDQEKVKVVYLTSRDAKDKRAWSGTLFNMAQSLSDHGCEVIYVGPYQPRLLLFMLKVFKRMWQFVFRNKYNINHSYLLSLAYKLHFSPMISKIKPDIIFAAAATPECSLLRLKYPVVLINDITFNLLKEGYSNYTGLSALSVRESNYIEKRAMDHAAAIVFSSEWAAQSAIHDYAIPADKVHVISYGANMTPVPTRDEVLQKTAGSTMRILFLGVDWERKGGDIVFDTFVKLWEQGIDVSLTVCGCVPPERCSHPGMIIIPFLNKNKEQDLAKLYRILLDTSFLFVPSKADCTPIAFCEANAFGIPVITTNVGGITSVIKDGVNGHTLPLEATADQYMKIFQAYSDKPEEYNRLVVDSRDYYEHYLNWDQWGRSLKSIFDCIQPTSGPF